MRFHGLVLAAMQGKPFIGIGRDHKLSDLCKLLSMPFIPLDDFDAQNAFESISSCVHTFPSPALIEGLRIASQKNFLNLEAKIK
jgi:polysaccharide pyruvyl transferase WcaK-like protein